MDFPVFCIFPYGAVLVLCFYAFFRRPDGTVFFSVYSFVCAVYSLFFPFNGKSFLFGFYFRNLRSLRHNVKRLCYGSAVAAFECYRYGCLSDIFVIGVLYGIIFSRNRLSLIVDYGNGRLLGFSVVRNMSKASAVIKCVLSYARYAVRKRDAFQIGLHRPESLCRRLS